MAIISILAAMLLPALHRAREMARIGVCKNNLKQMSLGWITYANNNQEHLPPVYDQPSIWPPAPLPTHPSGYSYWHVWDYSIAVYIDRSPRQIPFPWLSRVPGYFQCPSDDCPREYNLPRRSYALNTVFGIGCNYHAHGEIKAGKITRPAEMLVIVEHWTEHNRYYNGQQHWSSAEIPPLAYSTAGGQTEMYDFDMHYFPRYVVHPPNDTISADAGKGANCAFADGHVSFLTQPDMAARSPAIWNYNGSNGACSTLDNAY